MLITDLYCNSNTDRQYKDETKPKHNHKKGTLSLPENLGITFRLQYFTTMDSTVAMYRAYGLRPASKRPHSWHTWVVSASW
jgi:hypothetical protein